MERIILACLFILFGVLLTLAGIFNWKKFMYFIPKSNVWIETFGVTFYRIVISIIGIASVCITLWALITQ
ncbi:hypothetical protein Clo1100_0301 [Clostridium sp. BNL1100]|nr:hypothetical protein Clo1100_0301 [Clostridium sp. BNL1100]